MTPGDFNLQITIRNAHILRRIRAQYGSNAELCRCAGIQPTAVSGLLTMRHSPLTEAGNLTQAAEALCSALGASPSELWPKDMARLKAKKARHEIEISQAEAMAIAGSSEGIAVQRELLGRWARRLSPREITAISMSQTGANMDEIGAEFGVSRARAQQIIHSGFRKMREAANRDGVRSFVDISEICE